MKRRERFIIDGHNLIHKLSSLRKKLRFDHENARLDLQRLLADFAQRKGFETSLVFDGSEKAAMSMTPMQLGLLSVQYSQPPEKADPLIIRIMSEEMNPHRCTLVSSDKEIIRVARSLGITVQKSEIFSTELIPTDTNDEDVEAKISGKDAASKEISADEMREHFIDEKEEKLDAWERYLKENA